MVEQTEQPFTAEWVATATIKQLLAKCTDQKTPPDSLDFYQLIHLELVDRMKEKTESCAELAAELKKLLQSIDNSIRQQQIIQLLDTVSKNGTARFHKCLAGDLFTNPFLNHLKITRGKFNKVKLKVMKPQERLRRERSEKMMLALIQIWADTFMMEEDQYPGFQKIYRQLRKENVEFPMRDPNMRMFMGNICQSSPMFDFVEESVGREVNPQGQAEARKAQEEAQKQEEMPDFAANYAQDYNENNIEHEDEGTETVAQLVQMNITQDENEMVKQSLLILDELQLMAEDVEDMRGDYAMEIFETCIFVRRKSQKIVEAKNMAMDQGVAIEKLVSDMSAYLDLIETIDKKLNLFKVKYVKLRDKAIKDQQDAWQLEKERA